MTREYMERKLMEWTSWNPDTIKGWPTKQLKAIYNKEAGKIAQQIRINLGLEA
jgi:hypothetical protein